MAEEAGDEVCIPCAGLKQDDLLQQFEPWLAEQVAALERIMATAGAEGEQPSPDGPEGIFRIAHDLKGTGRPVGYDLVSGIGDNLCRLTRDRVAFTPSLLRRIGHNLAALKLVSSRRIRGSGGRTGEAILARLERDAQQADDSDPFPPQQPGAPAAGGIATETGPPRTTPPGES